MKNQDKYVHQIITETIFDDYALGEKVCAKDLIGKIPAISELNPEDQFRYIANVIEYLVAIHSPENPLLVKTADALKFGCAVVPE